MKHRIPNSHAQAGASKNDFVVLSANRASENANPITAYKFRKASLLLAATILGLTLVSSPAGAVADGGQTAQVSGRTTPVSGSAAPALSAAVLSSSVSVVIDGTRLSLEQPPLLANGRTLVPLRGIFEALGAEVRWTAATRTVTAVKGDTTVSLRIGQSTASVNGQSVRLDAPAVVASGRTMVPLRFVSEALGASVQWDARTSTVTIRSDGGSDGDSGGQPAPQTPDTESAWAAQVVSLVNEARSQAGLSALSSDSALARVAFDKAKDMADNDYFDHDSPTHGSPFEMMDAYGISYGYAGENIAKGQRTPQEVVDAWMNSPGHRANILSDNFTTIGVGYYNGHWVQMFTD
ncbi:stalk domain-containing protein [Paenibacillus sp. 598K]